MKILNLIYFLIFSSERFLSNRGIYCAYDHSTIKFVAGGALFFSPVAIPNYSILQDIIPA